MKDERMEDVAMIAARCRCGCREWAPVAMLGAGMPSFLSALDLPAKIAEGAVDASMGTLIVTTWVWPCADPSAARVVILAVPDDMGAEEAEALRTDLGVPIDAGARQCQPTVH